MIFGIDHAQLDINTLAHKDANCLHKFRQTLVRKKETVRSNDKAAHREPSCSGNFWHVDNPMWKYRNVIDQAQRL